MIDQVAKKCLSCAGVDDFLFDRGSCRVWVSLTALKSSAVWEAPRLGKYPVTVIKGSCILTLVYQRINQTMATSNSNSQGMVNPAIFEHLQTKLDEDAQVREEIRNIVQSMERQDRITSSVLSRAHSVPQIECEHSAWASQILNMLSISSGQYSIRGWEIYWQAS